MRTQLVQDSKNTIDKPLFNRHEFHFITKVEMIVIIILLGYAIGCFSTGFYLVQWRTKQDIRILGSGATGARNVGRILGKVGSVIVLLGDTLKGALAIWIALFFQLNPIGVSGMAIAVVAGHIWPAQLGFRGGKGLATGIGAIFIFAPLLALAILLLAAVLAGIFQQLTIGTLSAVAIAPLVAFLLGYPPSVWGGVVVMVVMVLYAHRENIYRVSRISGG